MIAAFIQARVSSSRLPGKVLKPILGRPMLEMEIERVRACRTVDSVVVVTSTAPEDLPIVELCDRLRVDSFRGDLENVLDRFYQAALKFRPEHIIRLTGDCPLIDAAVIDDMVKLYLAEGCDYATNCVPPTYPDGLDAEIFSFAVLERIRKQAYLPSHLEHVTLFVEENPKLFRIANLAYREDLSALRWTVDEPADLELVRYIFEALYPVDPRFGMADVLALLQHRPELALVNKQFLRNEGLIKSKEKDKAFEERQKS